MAFTGLFFIVFLVMRWLPMCIGAVLALRARRHCPRGPGMIALAFMMMLAAELLPLILSLTLAFAVNTTVAPGPGGGPPTPSFDGSLLIGIAIAVTTALLTLGSWTLLLLGIFSRRVGMLGYLIDQHNAAAHAALDD